MPEIYKNNLPENAWRYIKYLSFKMDCAAEQEEVMWRMDRPKAQKHYDELLLAQEEKTVELAKAMPKKVLTRQVSMPKVMTKKDGSASANAIKWYDLLKQQKLPKDTAGPITIVTGYEDGNPGSPSQVKDWLFSLGWRPATFKFDRNKKTGEEKQTPQVRYLKGHEKEGELCDSVLRLAKKDPAVEILDGLTIINHRLGFFKSMLENSFEVNGKWFVRAEIAGLTNTMRFKHSKPMANLPGVDKPWGEEIRSCFIAPDDDHVLCGWDMVSLESTTKRHFMYPHDPDYVHEMSQPGFDEHLDLAKSAGAITQQDIDEYNQGTRPDIKPVRKLYKPANYAGIYGVREKTLSRQTGLPVSQCKDLLEAYWQRNWSVMKVAKEQFVKTLKDGSMWLKNPVSGFYYSLRYDKDRFSTLNQGTGVYCFDRMVALARNSGLKFCGQFHDEGAFPVKRGLEEEARVTLNKCVVDLNKQLDLHIKLDIDMKFGGSYSEVH